MTLRTAKIMLRHVATMMETVVMKWAEYKRIAWQVMVILGCVWV